MNRQTTETLQRLVDAGISIVDAQVLWRISMTLHRWHELECGNGDDLSSWCIVRGHKRADGAFDYDDEGKPYLERHYHRGEAKAHYQPVDDRERGAHKRLAGIMARYPGFQAYVQTDPRGASLYILRPGDLSDGVPIDQVYNRGIAV